MASPQTGAGDPKRSLELLWREFEPQPSRPGPKPKLTLDQIVEAAVALADRDGIEAINMRGVAADLGVGTMTLYRYVPGKGELLDLMVDLLSRMGEEPDLSGLDWRARIELLAESTWEVFTEHPWLLEVNQRRPVLGPDSLAGYNFALSAFEGHDVSTREANLVVTAVMNMVTGTARQYLIRDSTGEGPAVPEAEWWQAQEPYLIKAIQSGRYERIARITDDQAWDIDAHEAMRYALDLFLDGLAPRMEASRKKD
ncbi:TetR/AcrR family transcriptional regulator [Glycomyces buryatensis]|uniref:TetR/AcrR family transcriptional regulator n=1 Tax=Glycomyces buryatensis TaxID=2570927 RepID=A0A4S8QEL3_9ACTN|nr:TetR/AcrR family transcriptional regulator C-terminal domain-containing protein [Glycomyces buryatensis]THV41532.1 TetR/AcrR family transcriptional regulator [Glycomyces buryatensis]